MTRQAVPVASQRPWPVPSGGQTIHSIGDTHVGAGTVPAQKMTKASLDMLNGKILPTVVARLQTGDQTENAQSSEDTTFMAWWNALTGAPKYLAMGNHDLFASRTGGYANWESTYGQARNTYADIGDFRLVIVSPDTLTTDESNPAWDGVRIRIPDATVAWLDGVLGGTSRDCLIACHAPIKDTVLGNPVTVYPSSADPWFVTSNSHRTDSSDLLAVLAAHTNAKAWISGHTHSPIDTPQLVTAQTVGSHTVAMINNSAVVYTGQNAGTDGQKLDSAMHGLYITHYGDRMEVRFRDHGAGVWKKGGGTSVKCVTVTF